MEAGEKDAEAPAGTPDTESETAELKPPETVVEAVAVALVPVAADTEEGDTENVKSGAEGDVTWNETVVECVLPPPVPVTVIVYVPTAAVPADSVRVDEPDPGAAIEV